MATSTCGPFNFNSLCFHFKIIYLQIATFQLYYLISGLKGILIVLNKLYFYPNVLPIRIKLWLTDGNFIL